MRLRVVRLGQLADGIAEGPDGPVIVPGALPGEEAEGAVAEGRMLAPRILVASGARTAPPCRHFGLCGGCALQHAADPLVSAWKEGQVRAALAAQGLAAPVRTAHVSPAGARRRAVFAGRRTRTGAVVGFHARASRAIVPVPDCRVLRPELVAALPALAALVEAGGSRGGTVDLAATLSPAGVDVAVTGGRPLDPGLAGALADLASGFALARLAWGGEVVACRAPPVQRFGRARVVPPPGAFLQATAEGEAALVSAVARAVGPARRIADLFAGCGTFALPLAERAEVHAVDGDAAMTAALLAGARAAPGLRVRAEARDLFRRPLRPDELAPFDAVVLDPPRAGAAAQAAALAASAVPVVALVSCHPGSFARDAATLAAAGFRLDWVEVVDQFRWSPHVELAARMSRPHIARRRADEGTRWTDSQGRNR